MERIKRYTKEVMGFILVLLMPVGMLALVLVIMWSAMHYPMHLLAFWVATALYLGFAGAFD